MSKTRREGQIRRSFSRLAQEIIDCTGTGHLSDIEVRHAQAPHIAGGDELLELIELLLVVKVKAAPVGLAVAHTRAGAASLLIVAAARVGIFGPRVLPAEETAEALLGGR